ncbi:MAG: hypothetical protein LUG95_07350 [Clostridiales bacterium]|nr:hypothetical protein [Clostridiales bacterium]
MQTKAKANQQFILSERSGDDEKEFKDFYILGSFDFCCAFCGSAYAEDEAESYCEYSYEATKTVDETCTEDGYTVYTCAICGDSYTEVIEATGHKLGSSTASVEPTCTTDGYTYQRCMICREMVVVSVIEKTGHTYSSSTTSASYSQHGSITYTCTICQDSYTEVVHSYDITEISPATCTQEGYTVYTCTVCGDSYTKVIALIAYGFGNNKQYCTVCGTENSDYSISTDSTDTQAQGIDNNDNGDSGENSADASAENNSSQNSTSSSADSDTSTNNNASANYDSNTALSSTDSLLLSASVMESTDSAETAKPKKTKIKKLKKGKKKFKVTRKKISGVTGYQIQYATNKKFTKNKKAVTVKGTKKTSKTIKKLRSQKTYYVHIRTYKTVNDKRVYSKWSVVKKVKTK